MKAVMGGHFKTVGLTIGAMAFAACETFDPTDPFASPGEFYDSKSRKELLVMARKGDYEAIRRLNDTPLQNLEIRVESGEHMAMMQLGWRYDTGFGVKTDPAEAARLYRVAAEHGDISMAQNNLGCLYRDGRGVIKDYRTAVQLFQMAAAKGNEHAQNNLGWMHERGYGLKRDYVKARHYYERAARQRKDFSTGKPLPGQSMAQNNLARLMRDGLGGKTKPQEAIRWFRKSAAQGNSHAHHNLGLIHEKGIGVKRNIRTC